MASHLGWLEGYPGDVRARDGVVRWHVLRGTSPVERVDSRVLRRASYALTKLTGEYRRALAKVVDDPAAWEAGVRAVIGSLKPAVHRDQPVPAELFGQSDAYRSRTRARAAALRKAHGALAPLVASLSWTAGGRDDMAASGLRWLERNASAVAAWLELTGEVRSAAQLLWLAQADGAARVAPLVQALADPRTHDTPVTWDRSDFGQMKQIIARRSDKTAADVPPEPLLRTMSQQLVGYVPWLCSQPASVRRTSLAWFARTFPGDRVAAWAEWNKARIATVASLRSALGRKRGYRLSPKTRARLGAALDTLLNTMPAALVNTGWMASLRGAANPRVQRHASAMTRALDAVPENDGVLSVAMLLVDWVRVIEDEDTSHKRVAELLTRFRALCAAAQGDVTWLCAWSELASWGGTRHWTVHDRLLDDFERHGAMRDWFRAMHWLCERGAQTDDVCARLFDMVDLTTDIRFAAATSVALCEDGSGWVDEHVLKGAVALAEGDTAAVVALAVAWDARPSEEYAIDNTGLVEVAGAFARAGAAWALRTLVQGGSLGRIARYGTQLRLARHVLSRLPRPTDLADIPAAWVDRYPPALRDALRRLASAHVDAEVAAAKLLARDAPDPAKLDREIEAIAERLAETRDDRMRARLDNLRHKRANPKPISERRLPKLIAKIDHAAALATFERWADRLDARLRAALPGALGLPAHVPWVGDPGRAQLLLGAVELPRKSRQLAMRLLALRCGPPPWDLRDAPQNQRYLHQLESAGIDWAPWVDGIGARTYQGDNNNTVVLSLEDDPLEVFAMGAHFNTCLRPGAMNYFSVFSNAADINKRVVYARHPSTGAVIGRCLLALTDSGQMVTFEPYCHDRELGFPQLIGRFAVELANAMGTAIVGMGHVPTLVAGRWYDDGWRDLAQQFPLLANGTAFSKGLATIAPSDLVVALNQALDPVGLCAQTLPLVLAHQALRDRPELLTSLIRLVEEEPALPDSLRVRTAVRIAETGDLDAARRLCRGRIVPYLLHSAGYEWVDPPALDLLVRLDPSQALRVLRQTRRQGQRRWTDETGVHRAFAAAKALEALHRPKQALSTYRHTLALGPDAETKDACEQRIAALG